MAPQQAGAPLRSTRLVVHGQGRAGGEGCTSAVPDLAEPCQSYRPHRPSQLPAAPSARRATVLAGLFAPLAVDLLRAHEGGIGTHQARLKVGTIARLMLVRPLYRPLVVRAGA